VHRGIRGQGAGPGRRTSRCEARWPSFSKHAVARGIRAVLASPIPYNQDAVGVVAVTSEDSHPWSAEAELALLAFTDLAALLIASMLLGEQQTELAAQLQVGAELAGRHRAGQGRAHRPAGPSPRTMPTASSGRGEGRRRKLAIVSAEVGARRHPDGRRKLTGVAGRNSRPAIARLGEIMTILAKQGTRRMQASTSGA